MENAWDDFEMNFERMGEDEEKDATNSTVTAFSRYSVVVERIVDGVRCNFQVPKESRFQRGDPDRKKEFHIDYMPLFGPRSFILANKWGASNWIVQANATTVAVRDRETKKFMKFFF